MGPYACLEPIDSVRFRPAQVWSAWMQGCAGQMEWGLRRSSCANGWHTCTSDEWRSQYDAWGQLAPTHDYWTDTDLRYGGGALACWVDTDNGTQCQSRNPAGALIATPMRVCTANGEDDWNGDGVVDNHCNWTRCGWEAVPPPNYWFGGCFNNNYAGVLCCR
jgi:hypothetical protein